MREAAASQELGRGDNNQRQNRQKRQQQTHTATSQAAVTAATQQAQSNSAAPATAAAAELNQAMGVIALVHAEFDALPGARWRIPRERIRCSSPRRS